MVAKLLGQRLTRSSATVSSRVSDDVHRSFVRANDPTAPMFGLSQTLGNQTMQRLLRSGAIQAKLSISQPGDPYEREADRVAEKVMRMPEPTTPGRLGIPRQAHGRRIQRVCSECEEELHRRPMEEEEEDILQARAVPGCTPEVAPGVEAPVNAGRGGGQPLPEPIRAFFEPRLSYDFSQVRVHTNSAAAESARAVNAQAFTLGHDVVFGAGQYAPGTRPGRRLLAHELAHVMQQTRGEGVHRFHSSRLVQRQPRPGASGSPLAAMARGRISGCRGDQNFFVDLARIRAPRWVAATIAGLQDYLNHPGGAVTGTESPLRRFFPPPPGRQGTIGGRHRLDHVQTIVNRLTRMIRTLENPRLFRCVSRQTCRREQGPNTLAYAGRGTRISICPNFFTGSPTDQIATLIHESAHQIGLMRNVISRDRVMALTLGQALNNAESYALLVIESFEGFPVPPRPAPPAPLTPNWSRAYMSSEVLFTQPVHGLFFEGGGRRRHLSDRHPSFEAPFPSRRPIRFRGQVRFYVDTPEVPMPAGAAVPEVWTTIQYSPHSAGQSFRDYFPNDDAPARYMGPGLPLLLPFDPAFDFTLTENGDLRFVFYMDYGAQSLFLAMYDDTIEVRPQNAI
ncbi:MAG TPA: DUF4157 domain-containing protein [Gammaproteobacteria bacterium]